MKTFSQAMSHFDWNFVVLLFSVVSAGGTAFLNCHFGKLTTDSYLAIADRVYDSKWYALPAKMQKYHLLLIMNAQVPLNYHGSNIAYLNLETYTRVK